MLCTEQHGFSSCETQLLEIGVVLNLLAILFIIEKAFSYISIVENFRKTVLLEFINGWYQINSY